MTDAPRTASHSPATSLSAADALLRHAVLDARRDVFGYELIDRSRAGQAVRETLLRRDPLQLVERRPLFLNVRAAALEALAEGDAVAPTLVLQVGTTADAGPQRIHAFLPTLHRLAQRGFQLAFDAGVLEKDHAAWLELAAYVRLDAQAVPPERVPAVLALLAQRSRARLLACEVQSQAQFEQLRDLGVPLFQGHWYARPTPAQAGTVQPSQAVLIQLVNLLRSDAGIEEIEALVKQEPTLAFDLLRIMNSSAMRRAVTVTSLRHAVMILGRERLLRWASVMMTRARAAGTAPAVTTQALVRARLMELLAQERMPAAQVDDAFLAGLFSLLDVLLDLPLPVALDQIAVPADIEAALLHDQGPLAPLLALARACERSDEAAFAQQAEALALTGHQVNLAHLHALAWAEELTAGW